MKNAKVRDAAENFILSHGREVTRLMIEEFSAIHGVDPKAVEKDINTATVEVYWDFDD